MSQLCNIQLVFLQLYCYQVFCASVLQNAHTQKNINECFLTSGKMKFIGKCYNYVLYHSNIKCVVLLLLMLLLLLNRSPYGLSLKHSQAVPRTTCDVWYGNGAISYQVYLGFGYYFDDYFVTTFKVSLVVLAVTLPNFTLCPKT